MEVSPNSKVNMVDLLSVKALVPKTQILILIARFAYLLSHMHLHLDLYPKSSDVLVQDRDLNSKM